MFVQGMNSVKIYTEDSRAECNPQDKTLHSGHFSSVLIHSCGNKMVAVKKYPKHHQRIFLNEIGAFQLIQAHSNIVNCLSVRLESRELMLEYINGPSLAQVMSEISSAQILKMFGDICEALKHLQTLRVVHNDIKPENILYSTEEKQWKLIDFGCATSYGDEKDSTNGTIVYMAPERYLSKLHDIRSDLWSLGIVTLQCLLKGKHPCEFYDDSPDYFALCFDLDDFSTKIPSDWYSRLIIVLSSNVVERQFPL